MTVVVAMTVGSGADLLALRPVVDTFKLLGIPFELRHRSVLPPLETVFAGAAGGAAGRVAKVAAAMVSTIGQAGAKIVVLPESLRT